MGFHQKVLKGTTIGLIFLVLFSLNAAAWSPAKMNADMRHTFSSKFGSSYHHSFERAAHDTSSNAPHTFYQTTQHTYQNGNNAGSPQPARPQGDAFGSAYWNTWAQNLKHNVQQNGFSENTQMQLHRANSNRGATQSFSDNQRTTPTHHSSTPTATGTTPPTGNQASGSNTVQPTGSVAAQAEVYLNQYLNQERQKRGLSPLTFDSNLRQTARQKSQEMAQTGIFAHTINGQTFRDIYAAHGITRSECPLGGENIAQTWFDRNVRTDVGNIVHYTTAKQLADGLRRQWMNSPEHRANILRSQYTKQGIGISITSSGEVYATEQFCS